MPRFSFQTATCVFMVLAFSAIVLAQERGEQITGRILAWGNISSAYAPTLPPGFEVLSMVANDDDFMALVKGSDGVQGVMTWGEFGSFSEVPAAAQSNVTAVAMGTSHRLALLVNGTLIGWDVRNSTAEVIPRWVSQQAVQKIAACEKWSMAALSNGSIVTWMQEASGAVPGPVQSVGQADSVQQVAIAGMDGIFAFYSLIGEATVDGFRNGALVGLLSNGSKAYIPAELNDKEVLVLRGGVAGAAVIVDRRSYTVYAWTDTDTLVPGISVNTFRTTDIFVGTNRFLAVQNGDVKLFPEEDTSGTSYYNYDALSQVAPEARIGVSQVVAGQSYAAAYIKDSGTLVGWGAVLHSANKAVPLAFNSSVKTIASVDDFVVVVLDNDTVLTWGSPFNGQLSVPDDIQGKGVKDIALGDDFALVLLESGKVRGWGIPGNRINVKAGADFPIPDVVANSNVTAIAAVSYFMVAVLQNKTMVSWGFDGSTENVFQLPGNASKDAQIVDIAVCTWYRGAVGFFVILDDGSGWWYRTGKWLPGQPYLRNVKKIDSVGSTNSVIVLHTNGSITALTMTDDPSVPAGRPAYAPPLPADITDVAVSSQSYAVLTSNGTIVKWTAGLQSGEGASQEVFSMPNITSIALGTSYVVAVQEVPVLSPESSSPASTPTSPSPPVPSNGPTKTSAVIPAAVASVAGTLAIAAGIIAFVVIRRRRQQPTGYSPDMATDKLIGEGKHSAVIVLDRVMDIPGLSKTDPFLRGPAFAFSWVDKLPKDSQAVEADRNDVALDQLLAAKNGTGTMTRLASGSCSSSGVVELSHEELVKQVHIAKDGLLGRGSVLAIKVLKDGQDADLEVMKSFAYEATVLQTLRHPHIVRLYGYCLEPPTICLIMELLPSSLSQIMYPDMQSNNSSINPLSSFISYVSQSALSHGDSLIPVGTYESTARSVQSAPPSQQLHLDMRAVLTVSRDVAAALAFLHQHQVEQSVSGAPTVRMLDAALSADGMLGPNRSRVVYRDLKPANVAIASDGSAKVIDFGLARQVANSTVHTVHMGAGTLPYLSPEQLLSHKSGMSTSITSKVDVYSLGMMMWELLACQRPWQGMADHAIMAAAVSNRRPPLPLPTAVPTDTISPSLTAHMQHPVYPELANLIKSCWHKRDHKRPTTPQVHEQLQALLNKL